MHMNSLLRWTGTLSAALLCVWAVSGTARAEAIQGNTAAKTVWDGVYKSDQARAGQAIYVEWCANCHGRNGEGAQQGPLRFPPLTGVGAKPRRSVDDIVGLLKTPEAYGLQPPMRSFSEKITEPEMKEIAEWVVKL